MSSFSSSWIRRALRSTVATVALALPFAFTAGCGEAPPPPKDPANTLDAAEQAKIKAGQQLIRDAETAAAELKYDKARELLHKAEKLGVESQRFQIKEAIEKVDKRHAKAWSTEVADRFKAKDCAGAFKDLMEPMSALESEAFTHEIRRLVGPSATKCLEEKSDEQILAGELSAARKEIDTPEAREILGAASWKKLSNQVEATIFEALRAQLKDDLAGQRWSDAVAKIDASVKKGDATAEQERALVAAVREKVAPEIEGMAARALGQRDAPKALKEVDGLIQLVRWEIMAPELAELAKDKALPPTLAQRREALGVWVEAQRLSMKLAKKPEKRWAHGKIALGPGSASGGASRRDVAHGAEVWVIGTTKQFALVAAEDPTDQALAGRINMAIGWAPVGQLAGEPTIDWVLPAEQLVGQRVWGPLRKDSGLYELGIVSAVSGKDISVKRIADDVEVKVTRNQLRTGSLSSGTKVLTVCDEKKDQLAQVVDPPVGRMVKLKCENGDEKQEALPFLRTKPELLPPTK